DDFTLYRVNVLKLTLGDTLSTFVNPVQSTIFNATTKITTNLINTYTNTPLIIQQNLISKITIRNNSVDFVDDIKLSATKSLNTITNTDLLLKRFDVLKLTLGNDLATFTTAIQSPTITATTEIKSDIINTNTSTDLLVKTFDNITRLTIGDTISTFTTALQASTITATTKFVSPILSSNSSSLTLRTNVANETLIISAGTVSFGSVLNLSMSSGKTIYSDNIASVSTNLILQHQTTSNATLTISPTTLDIGSALNFRMSASKSIIIGSETPVANDYIITKNGGNDLLVRGYDATPEVQTIMTLKASDQSVVFATDVTIQGNLTINGDNTSINISSLEIADNILLLNKGEAGIGVTEGTSGIEIDRGTATEGNFQIVFSEDTNDYIQAGFVGALKVIPYRNSAVSMTDTGITYWNASANRIDSATNIKVVSEKLTLSTDLIMGTSKTIYGTNGTTDNDFWFEKSGNNLYCRTYYDSDIQEIWNVTGGTNIVNFKTFTLYNVKS
ncbi:hypothetical protein MEO93_28855, partial [Dolichospermum sp. ST_sed3]|nr:hypothetical protein [Dolichospermum sp. ST_sed3]